MSLPWNVALPTVLSLTLAGAGLAKAEHFHPPYEAGPVEPRGE